MGTFQRLRNYATDAFNIDAKLNAAYRASMARLNARQKGRLQAAQRAWIAFRDAECEAQTDEEILAAFRRYGGAGLHACGTCAMGQGPEAVVDELLRVRGVEGLRVMDTSIYPEMLSGNTNAPTMALAWRASDLILEDRG